MIKFFLITLLASYSTFAAPSTGTGTSNGGDTIRAQFILRGQEVIAFLKDTEKGQKIVSDLKLNLTAISETLDIRKILVVTGPLVDNLGSIVDAIGVPGLIQLDNIRWETLISSGNDIYYLIFHEMLRSAAINDDGYIISFKINPFFKSPSLPYLAAFGPSYQGNEGDHLIKFGEATAVIYKNSADGSMRLGMGFQENSLSADACSAVSQYGNNPSDTNPKQRLFSIINLRLEVGLEQDLANTNYWKDQISPAGRVFFFDTSKKETEFAHLYAGATGHVTITKLTDDSVTVKIVRFQITENNSFTMNGTATLKICK